MYKHAQEPWKVSINPFGLSKDGIDNIFLVSPDGGTVAIIAKHPVWKHLEDERIHTAERIIACIKHCHNIPTEEL